MQFRKRSCVEGLQSYGHFCTQVQSNTEKDRTLKDFCVSSVCEEGELPRTL